MTKEILSKLSRPNTALDVTDMTPEEKRLLYAFFEQHGASQGFTYDRFFKEGFTLWELDCINQIKIDYMEHLHTKEKVSITLRAFADGSQKFFYTIGGEERSFDILAKGDFWRFLGDIQYRKHFGTWMYERGMRSYNTVSRRFSEDDWRDYEKEGILLLFEDFAKTIQ